MPMKDAPHELPISSNMRISNALRQVDQAVQNAVGSGRGGVSSEMSNVIDALGTLMREQDARLRRDVDEAISEALASRQSPAEELGSSVASLYVLPDADSRQHALDTLDTLRKATDTLYDANAISDAHKMIMERLMFPAIDELRTLLSVEALPGEGVGPRRIRSLVTATGLMETAKTVGIVISATAEADDAADSAVTGAHKLIDAGIALSHVVARLIGYLPT